MSTLIKFMDLAQIIENREPEVEGAALAKALLAREDVDWSDIAVDLRGWSAGFQTVSFHYGFLQQIHDTRPELLEQARRVKWMFTHDAYVEIISKVTARFVPWRAKKVA